MADLRAVLTAASQREDLPDLLVGGRREVLVPEPDGVEGLRGRSADHAVDFAGQLVASLGRGDGHGDDDLPRPLPAERFDGCAHRCPGGEAIVDEHYRPPRDLGRWAPVPIQALALVQLLHRPFERPVELFLGHLPDERGIDEDDASGGDRPHRELLVAGKADLANHEDVEWRTEAPCHRLRHRYASARQCENEEVSRPAQVFERVRELFARVAAVAVERHAPRLGPPPEKTTPKPKREKDPGRLSPPERRDAAQASQVDGQTASLPEARETNSLLQRRLEE